MQPTISSRAVLADAADVEVDDAEVAPAVLASLVVVTAPRSRAATVVAAACCVRWLNPVVDLDVSLPGTAFADFDLDALFLSSSP